MFAFIMVDLVLSVVVGKIHRLSFVSCQSALVYMLHAVDRLFTAECMLPVQSLHTTTCAATRACGDPGDLYVFSIFILHVLDLFAVLR